MPRNRAVVILLALVVLALASQPSTAVQTRATDQRDDPSRTVPRQIKSVGADAETAPTREAGDAADDPAIWVSPLAPQLSLIVGNDKQGSLEVYNLDGSLRQRVTTGTHFWGNVDVRQQVHLGGERLDVVAAINGGLRFYLVDPVTRTLVAANEGGHPVRTHSGEGVCLYDAGGDGLYAFVVARSGRVREYAVRDTDGDALLTAARVRQFWMTSEGEGCVVDDARDALYLSQEDVGLWRLGAEPDAGAAKTLVDKVGAGGHLVSDVEGVTLAVVGSGGYLIVSAQNVAHPNKSYFAVYRRGNNNYVGAFRVVRGPGSDGCSRTDGVAAYAGPLGPDFPDGVFVCQDNTNTAPAAGHQNFKLTRLGSVVTLR